MRLTRAIVALAFACLAWAGDERTPTPLLQWTLHEVESAVEGKMGSPAHSTRSRGYSVLEFGEDSSEHNDLGYEWIFYFEQPSGQLLSVTHNFSRPGSVDDLFPPDATRAHRLNQAGSPPIDAISRLLPGDRVLIAIGLSKSGERCTQITLMRKAVVGRFYPWIAADLK